MRRRRQGLATAGRLYLAAVLLFLYVPIVVMAVMSFNASKLYRLPVDWSLTWYGALAHNDRLIDAGLNSLWVALVTTVIATALGTAASLAFFSSFRRAPRMISVFSIEWARAASRMGTPA